ncbi:hypothetical protein [Halorubrum ezzemoulense]|uniref:hypothetical protein n=1 Tax=Halorubrum ezzemoulense TaxID=337243 RepID=UPI00232B8548|nr:hypothetical protein [Halorubrum ezzemoulense]MDB9235539.1 hypothetical protein [Halorubrum ezzemoulense]
MTTSAWHLAQLLDVRIVTIDDLTTESLPPLTEHRPPRGTFRTRREPRVSELRDKNQLPLLTERRPPGGTLHARREPLIQDLRDRLPLLVHRRSSLDIEAPVFHGPSHGPCYVPDRTGNTEYVSARDSDYDFG